MSSFRIRRQPPTIVTWAELDFYGLIRPSVFVNSGRHVSVYQTEWTCYPS